MYLIALALIVAGLAIGAYAAFAPRRPAVATAASQPGAPAQLSEAQRVDAVLATGSLESDDATAYLVAALDDPSEAVALAAAHALAGSGRGDALRRHLESRPGERSERLADTIGWMHDIPET